MAGKDRLVFFIILERSSIEGSPEEAESSCSLLPDIAGVHEIGPNTIDHWPL
jgi:hypothetical protein